MTRPLDSIDQRENNDRLGAEIWSQLTGTSRTVTPPMIAVFETVSQQSMQ